jgi:hypothetical protein
MKRSEIRDSICEAGFSEEPRQAPPLFFFFALTSRFT